MARLVHICRRTMLIGDTDEHEECSHDEIMVCGEFSVSSDPFASRPVWSVEARRMKVTN
jgi:hypothetical protein